MSPTIQNLKVRICISLKTVWPYFVLITKFYVTAFGSTIMGSKPGVIESSLHVLLQAPDLVPEEQKFDLIVLVRFSLHNHDLGLVLIYKSRKHFCYKNLN